MQRPKHCHPTGAVITKSAIDTELLDQEDMMNDREDIDEIGGNDETMEDNSDPEASETDFI